MPESRIFWVRSFTLFADTVPATLYGGEGTVYLGVRGRRSTRHRIRRLPLESAAARGRRLAGRDDGGGDFLKKKNNTSCALTRSEVPRQNLLDRCLAC